MRAGRTGLGLVFQCAVASTASAGHIDWVTWQSFSLGNSGIASGVLNTVQGPISATYAGNLYDAWLSPANSGNVDPWPGLPHFTAYATPQVDNLPPDHQVLWQVRGTWSATLTFSEPVSDIYMPITSLGGGVGPLYAVNYQFNMPFDIVSAGSGRYGEGVFQQDPGNTLHGEEGHGIIHFAGPVTSISWDTTYVAYEGTNGFTFGIASVPTPGTALVGLIGLGLCVRRRR